MVKKEKSQGAELEKMKLDLEKMREEKSQVAARVKILEEAEAKRNGRRTKRSRDRVLSFNSTIPEKTARRDDRTSNHESRKESVFVRRDVQFIRGPDLQMEDRFSRTEARKRDGYAPVTKPPTEEQTNEEFWYNWRSSRQSR